MARRARPRKLKASLRMVGGKTLLVTPGLKRIRPKRSRASLKKARQIVDKMVDE
ncbi:hypothetical protein HWB99_gp008 [Mycobacterium phage DrLupo]|uniref:Uncharacterized protein n=1 Tax=Mycobacterium phage DrLupo TaxID=2499037 RepID=A0A3S9UQI6_9CAUD|nr:hypothetical protein HWB99_gp008 [Mycobacterium phage DrLupo]AZS12544.1 hypothetical protein SEA_DRLUPO_8 [Mycobacterium phage DrLupo]